MLPSNLNNPQCYAVPKPLVDFSESTVELLMTNIDLFCRELSGITLRPYQLEVARSIIDSVLHNKALSFVVIFPRQSGKNELQAQIEAFLLTWFSRTEAEIVKVSPTWKPQSLNAMRRLERNLRRNSFIYFLGWVKENGFIYAVQNARITFLSGAPTSSIVGATASTLLECDEAQDIGIDKYDKEISPMAASTNATKVFWGTAWTSQTLLAREMRTARIAQDLDGVTRVFQITSAEVALSVPAYGAFVAAEILKLGRNHPFIRTQFFSEEIEISGGMFTEDQRILIQGIHFRQSSPYPGNDVIYAFLIDVGGQNEISDPTLEIQENSTTIQDATALTIISVDLATIDDPLIHAPTYKIVNLRQWQNTSQVSLYAQIKGLVDVWDPKWIVIDATGLGAGLSSFLLNSFPRKVLPFIFSATSKSRLGWSLISLIETRRLQIYSNPDDNKDMFDLFFNQFLAAQMEIVPGPDRKLRWGVVSGSRDPFTGEYQHDDLLISAALASVLDSQAWGTGRSAIIKQKNILSDMKEVF